MKHIISLGAGVQSSTMALMAAHGEITPMPDAAIFADTQAEPASVYKWLDWLETKLPFPVIRVTAGSLAEDSLTMKVMSDGRKYSRTHIPFYTLNDRGERGKIPHRGCTAEFKIRPITKAVRGVLPEGALREWRRSRRDELRELRIAKKAKDAFQVNQILEELQNEAPVVQWIGISLDEVSRVKPSREPWISLRHPLIEKRMSRHDCIQWIREREYPEPPRSACVFCPFHNNAEWRRLKIEESEEFQRAVEFEIALQKAKENTTNGFDSTPYLHPSRKPLESIDFSSAEDRGQLNFFENECEGMCGV